MTHNFSSQTDIDKANTVFWDELCGSEFAKRLGVIDMSSASLKKYDDWYLSFYPYLLSHVPVETFSGKKVLEVGLGYGTLGEQIAMSGAFYVGMDIAHGPVDMINHRLYINKLPGGAVKGSMLNTPIKNDSIDVVVSIGCFHHTGNLQRCLEETWRILKPGGKFYLMIYNKYSYRQWIRWPKKTFMELFYEFGFHNKKQEVSMEQRAAYDTDSKGKSAPETAFYSCNQLKKLLCRFVELKFAKENCEDFYLNGKIAINRQQLFSVIGKSVGLDIYFSGAKPVL